MIYPARFTRVILGLLLSSSLSFAGEVIPLSSLLTESRLAHYKEAESFLKRLGFEDFVAEVNQTLAENKNISDISIMALRRNQTDLRAFNAVRDLSSLTYAILKSTENAVESKSQIRLLTSLIIQQLKPFPHMTAEPLPIEEIAKIKPLPINEGMVLRNKWIVNRANDRFFEEKLNVLKLYMALLKVTDKENKNWVKALDRVLFRGLADPYTLEKRQQNRLFGRALIVTLVKFLRETKNTAAETELKSNLRQNQLYLENYILGYYVVDAGKNDLRGNQLQSGDIALEYSHGQEAYFTSLVIQPQSPETKKAAVINHLNNSVLDSYKFFDTKKYYALLDKRDTYREWTSEEKTIYSDFWSRDYANGFSHVGMVKVHQDDVSQIKVAWIWDIYPEKNKIGSVRILSADEFAHPSGMLKIGFLRYEPEKLLSSLRAQYKKRGFLKNIWEGYSSFVGKADNGNFIPSFVGDSRYTWQTKVDQKDVERWVNSKDLTGDVWFKEEALPRIFDRLRSYLVSSEAKLFADGLISAKDMLYCSQLVNMAFLEAVNLDLQNSPDRIWEFLKYASDSIKNVLKLNIKDRIVSPNGLVWQQDIFKNLFTVYLDRSDVLNQRTQVNPTVAEKYSTELKAIPEIKAVEVDEDPLLILDDDEIQIDLES